MNGATAEPCVRTRSPPKSAITSSTGSSQNFFRVRRNDHSSRGSVVMRAASRKWERGGGDSERVAHGRGRGLGRAHDPVARGRRVKADAERVAREYTTQRPG